MLKVVKFGGSSVAGPEQFAKVRNIVLDDPSRRIVVISAAGKRSSGDHKLTDLLYLCHAHLTYGVSCEDILEDIKHRFSGIRDELGLSYPVEQEFDALSRRLTKDTPVDELVSRGEYFTSRLMAEYLGYDFIDAASCIFFSIDGQLDINKTYAAVKAALEEHDRIVIPGFYGSLPGGRIKVMTRGGSDITGALAAAAVNADVYENWTDVSGILMADPRIVDKPRPIETITYSELRELAFMGASVLHEDAVQPVRDAGISLNIRNTNRPQDRGTYIVSEAEDNDDGRERFLTGIAGRKNFHIITITRRGMNTNEVLGRALGLFDRYHVPVEHITLGLDSFALVAASSALGDNLYSLMGDIEKECRPDNISIQDGIALVAAVGRKMTFRPGISGRLFNALGEQNINIRTIAQGADELSIIIGVENAHYEDAVRILYDGFAG